MKDRATAQLYNIMQSVEGRLGGGEGVEGIYGSITATGMQKILDCLHHNCGLDSSSALVDVGAGLCRPLLHALVSHGVCRTYGVELDRVKVDKAGAFTQQTLQQLLLRGVELPGGSSAEPILTCAAIEQVASLEPATHAYSFWEGVPRTGKAAFGRLFRASKSLKAVAVVQRAIRQQDPCMEMRQLGFGPLLLIKSFKVSMSGSGRSFTAYVFSKCSPMAAAFLEGRAPGSTAAKQTQQHNTAHDEGGSESEPESQQKGRKGGLVALCTTRVPLSPVKRSSVAGIEDSPTKKHKGVGECYQEQQHTQQAYRLRPTRLSYAQPPPGSGKECCAAPSACGKENSSHAQQPAADRRSACASGASARASSAPRQRSRAAQPAADPGGIKSRPGSTAHMQRGGHASSSFDATGAVASSTAAEKGHQAVTTRPCPRLAPKLQLDSKPGRSLRADRCSSSRRQGCSS